MRNKVNVIIGTNNFGLGPVGKVSSIINNTNDDINWYACGNKFDLKIFKEDAFKDKLFVKDKEEIKKFVLKNNIKFGVVVLDVELAKILMSLSIKVLFVDSLPFMWTQADIDEGLLPLEADYYCAQKCINLTKASEKVLSQIKNLIWINPIQNKPDDKYRPFDDNYIHINVGGLHSPIGNGESYIQTVLIPVINVLNKLNKNVLITGGDNAKRTILKVFKENNIDIKNIKIETLIQEQFLSAVKYSTIFLTSPGLTTIYETSSLKKPTLLLPPQNLSQFYNIEYAKKIIDRYKILNWNTKKLNYEYLQEIFDKGETYVVEQIYKYITELIDSDFILEFENRFDNILYEKYFNKKPSNFIINGNGSDDIKKIILGGATND